MDAKALTVNPLGAAGEHAEAECHTEPAVKGKRERRDVDADDHSH
jgi:hypothetical protein